MDKSAYECASGAFVLNMKKASIIIWKDEEGVEHAYLLDRKSHIIPESFEFWLRARSDTKEVKRIEVEPILDEHSMVIIKSLEPVPKQLATVMNLMKTEHGATGSV